MASLSSLLVPLRFNAKFTGTIRILVTGYRHYGRRRYQEKGPPTLSDRILTACHKSDDLNEAMKLFRELTSSENRPEERIFTSLLRMCMNMKDREKGDEIIEYINQYYGTDPGVSLITNILNYYCAIEDHHRTWQMYQEMIKQNIPLRKNVSFKLIELALKNKDHTHIGSILTNFKKIGAEMDHQTSAELFKLAANEDVASPWQQFAKILIEIYYSSQQLVERELADVMIKWFKNYWGPSTTSTLTTIENGGKCTHCGSQLEDNKLTDTEINNLLHDTKLSLYEQIKSFEDSYRETLEVKRLVNLCSHTGTYGAVLDGLNVAGGEKDTERLTTVAEWAVNHTQKPVLIISRAHLCHHFRPSRRMSELTYEYKKMKNIHLFFSGNKVADDYFTIYGALASGKDTYVISNDKMGDHISRMNPQLRDTYHKWLRSVRINFSDEPNSSIVKSLLLPKGYDRTVQWTDTHCHIPLEDELPSLTDEEWDESQKWLCIKK